MRKVTRSAEERVRLVGNMIIRSIARRDRDTRSERGKVQSMIWSSRRKSTEKRNDVLVAVS